MAPLKHARRDFALGLLALACIEGLVWSRLGMAGHCTLAWAFVAFALSLWNAGTPFRKIAAVILAPSILLAYLLPKDLREAVKALPSAPAPASEPQ
jgi:hypothetical protein